ncbi:unnamed protein product [Mytilus coruscus]|uniref:Uncharacterized protein n=1 Tax=Mytilus coruscus TaxID=42192 RepID=A0A6J8CZT7_MYTCO|nr:unnamed protein product [Mytilus coruscus]
MSTFKDLKYLPSTISLNKLDDGSGLQSTMYKSNAKWHKTCYLKFSSKEIKRKQKRNQEDTYDMSEKTANNRNRTFTCTILPCKIAIEEYVCFFCSSNKPDENLHEVTTRNVDIRVRQCALKFQDTAFLVKLSAGHLVVQEAKYHIRCLANLHRKASRVSSEDESEKGNKNLGVGIESRIHSTRLKNRLLAYFPDIQEYKQGRESLLVFKDDVGHNLQRAYDDDFDSNYMQIYKAVKIIRSNMFSVASGFDGRLPVNCQEKLVPRSLLTLLRCCCMDQIYYRLVFSGNNNDCTDVNIPQLQTNP